MNLLKLNFVVTGLLLVSIPSQATVFSIDLVDIMVKRNVDVYAIINNGRMPSSLILGCSRCTKPINWRANPDEETTDWRARRGKTAHWVRREGTAIAVPYPLSRQCDLHITRALASAWNAPALSRPPSAAHAKSPHPNECAVG